MHLERERAQEVRVRLQGIGGDDFEAWLGSRHRGAARQSLRWAHAQRRPRASRTAYRSEAGRDLRRQRLSRESASSGERRSLHLRPQTERHAETIAAPSFSHRASDRTLETRPPDETKLLAGPSGRRDQCLVGRQRLQLEKTPASFLLALFRLA